MEPKQKYGPPKIMTNESEMKIRQKEKTDFKNGDATYGEILYASYTPCGPIYSMISKIIKSNQVGVSRELLTNYETQSEDVSEESSIIKNFQSCTRVFQTFYLGRKRNLDEFVDTVKK
jgi:hypothetical protein